MRKIITKQMATEREVAPEKSDLPEGLMIYKACETLSEKLDRLTQGMAEELRILSVYMFQDVSRDWAWSCLYKAILDGNGLSRCRLLLKLHEDRAMTIANFPRKIPLSSEGALAIKNMLLIRGLIYE